MKRMLTWIWLLTKRLYKRPAFLALLLLIPLLVAGYTAVAREDSGLVTIALACEDPQDALALQIMDSLTDEARVVRFLRTDTPQAAQALVVSQRADGAWIFPAELQTHIAAYAAGETSGGFIRVVEGQTSAALTLAREKLGGAVFHSTSQAFFLHYLRDHAPALADLTDDALLQYYAQTLAAEELFSFTTLTGEQPPETVTYLTAPLRGMLAAVVVLCALAGAVYHTADLESGTFSWVPEGRRGLVELGGQLILAVNVLLAVVLALGAVGLTVHPLREAALFVLYAVACAAFGALLRVLCPGRRMLAALLPVLAVATLIVCPVFLQTDALKAISWLLPPTWYILGAYDGALLPYFVLYDVALAGLYYLLKKLLRR